MEKDQKFTENLGFRLFSEEYKKIQKVVMYAEDVDGGRKYDNISHFCRCAVMKLLFKEHQQLKRTMGRPMRFINEREKSGGRSY